MKASSDVFMDQSREKGGGKGRGAALIAMVVTSCQRILDYHKVIISNINVRYTDIVRCCVYDNFSPVVGESLQTPSGEPILQVEKLRQRLSLGIFGVIFIRQQRMFFTNHSTSIDFTHATAVAVMISHS